MFRHLYEATSQAILEGIDDEAKAIAERSGGKLTPGAVINLAKEVSTPYWKWVLSRWFKENFRLPEDKARIQSAVANFDRVKARLPNKDIGAVKTIKDLEDLTAPLVDTPQSAVSKKTHDLNLPGVKVIKKQGPYTTIEVTDVESLKKLGEGTKWCTRGSYPDCMAEQYLEEQGKIYDVFENGRPVLQYTPDYTQVMDVEDEEVDGDSKLGRLVVPPVMTEENWDNIEYYIQFKNERVPEAEHLILKDSDRAMSYAKRVGRIPEMEPAILKDPENAQSYAEQVMGERWPEAEPIIMTEPWTASNYAKNVIKGRWPEAEPIILKDVRAATDYAQFVIEGRWPELEALVIKDPPAAARYAVEFIEGRWPEAEPIIITDPRAAYMYAVDNIKGRWPEAEPTIMTDPYSAAMYAFEVMKDLWPEAEPIIKKDGNARSVYRNLKRRVERRNKRGK